MKIVSFIIYIILQVAFIPLAIIGVALTGYKQIAVSKRLGISQTAIEIINGRWTMHIFGLRDDPDTASFISVLPNTSTLGLWLVLFPLWVQTRISGQASFYPRIPSPGDEKIADLVPARTAYIDTMIKQSLPEMEQFVLMGAGYDTRAYSMFDDYDLKCFELDQRSVQAHKREMLAKTSINTDPVTFVSVDFSQDNLFAKLQEAGFDNTKKTLFLWEGVTLYLSEAEVKQTLQLVKEQAAPGSILLADIYAERMIAFLGKSKAAGKVLEMTDEALNFGLPFDQNWESVLSEFIESQSMQVGATHFLGSNDKNGPYGVVAEVSIP